MEQATTILTILTEVAPLVLAVLILAGVVGLTLYTVIRVAIPALRETVEMFEAQRKSWKAILDEQVRVNERLAEEARKDIERLEGRVKELVELVQDKDRRIAALEAKLTTQEAEIKQLREENGRLREENTALRERLRALEEKDEGKSKKVAV